MIVGASRGHAAHQRDERSFPCEPRYLEPRNRDLSPSLENPKSNHAWNPLSFSTVVQVVRVRSLIHATIQVNVRQRSTTPRSRTIRLSRGSSVEVDAPRSKPIEGVARGTMTTTDASRSLVARVFGGWSVCSVGARTIRVSSIYGTARPVRSSCAVLSSASLDESRFQTARVLDTRVRRRTFLVVRIWWVIDCATTCWHAHYD